MATKIETHLTPEQFQDFCRRVAAMKGGLRLGSIQALAEEFGVEISLMAARSFRDGPMAGYLDELKAKRELAESVAQIAQNGLSLGDATASVLSQKIFDQALGLDVTTDTALADSNKLSLAISRLRRGDQSARKLEADLKIRDAQIERLERDNAEKSAAAAAAKAAIENVIKDKKGISREALQRMEEAAKLL